MARQERAVRTRSRIVQAAAQAFRDQGYEGTSTTDILKRAEVTRGALYFHFPSKEAIADAVVEHQIELLPPPVATSSLQRVIDITFRLARALQDDIVLQAAVRLAVEETSYHSGRTVPDLWSFQQFSALLQTAQEAGELLPGVDVEDTATMVVGAFTGIQLVSQLSHSRRDMLHRVSVFWQTALPGIAVPGLLMRLDVGARRVDELERTDAAEQGRSRSGDESDVVG
ncbi:ScbR family autoregulator-binding transcription factor [Streptomyces hygroscopicus]|uniref:ScbR family autoregulator-binding transcription factor n=1 Tax=Streptomyces hygroscopicus TaxID=1912 RepID=UPI001FCB0C07|nr:ScbR family autoregulator-binding transcription factor [Streptomyces hygroscopicus]BDH13448.1 gamma-butyrolactone-binding protein [Streptomyces hygroscopicus]